MPYIEKERRKAIEEAAVALASTIQGPGELNFAITRTLIHLFIGKGGITYAVARGIIGDLECVKQEFYRRVVAPYEDKKKRENGDVYPD